MHRREGPRAQDEHLAILAAGTCACRHCLCSCARVQEREGRGLPRQQAAANTDKKAGADLTWTMKLDTTRPSDGFMRGPKVLKMRATRTSTLPCPHGMRSTVCRPPLRGGPHQKRKRSTGAIARCYLGTEEELTRNGNGRT